MAVSIMASCALPSVYAEEVSVENVSSVSEEKTESGYTGTMKEIIEKYEAEGALVFDLARDEGRRNLKTLVIEPDGKVHYLTDESYDIVTMKEGTEPPYEQVNGRYLEKNRVEFVKEEGSNSYRFAPSGNQFDLYSPTVSLPLPESVPRWFIGRKWTTPMTARLSRFISSER